MNDTQGMILGLLTRGPRTGGEINRAAKGLAEFWTYTKSQTYRELRTLQAAGLIKAGKPNRQNSVVYSLAARGRKEFNAWLQKPGKVTIRDSERLRKHLTTYATEG